MVGLLTGCWLSAPQATRAQVVDTTFCVADGPVDVMVRSGSRLYLGGSFAWVGPRTGGGAPLDTSSGRPPGLVPKVVGTVLAVVPDGAGGWFIGGGFTSVGGEPRSNLAHVDQDLSVSAWNPGTNDTVRALVMIGSVVYAGGDFTSVGGQTRDGLAAVNAVSGAIATWNPDAKGGVVRALAVSGSTIYVGGNFGSVNGQTRPRLAAVDAVTGTPSPWNPSTNNEIDAIAVSASTVYVGGRFMNINGQTRNRVAAFDLASGTLIAGWNPNASCDVYALAVNGPTVYVGGCFTSIGGATRNRIAALDATTGSATAWNPNADQDVRALVATGSIVYAGGTFTSIGGLPRNKIAALDASGSAASWNPSADGTVYALAASGTSVYAGGAFFGVGGAARNGIAALDLTTGLPMAWDPNANGEVRAIVPNGSVVYVGGTFTSVGGQARNRIAALDATTGAATAWNPNATGGGGALMVNALAVAGTTVYAGGQFTNIGGQNRNKVAALDATSGNATAWNPNVNNLVWALAVSGSTVYAGGTFNQVGPSHRNLIAAIDAATGLATPWTTDVHGGGNTVLTILLSGPVLYVGGVFSSVGSLTRNNIASIDVVSAATTAWNPNASDTVKAVVMSDCILYAGGSFGSIGGQPRDGLAALDTGTGDATSWNANVTGEIRALVLNGSSLYTGGAFNSIGGAQRDDLASVSVAPEVTTVLPSAGGNDGVVTVTISGVNLSSCTAVKLQRAGQPDIVGTHITAASSLTATFDLRGVAAGAWDVVVAHAGGTATLANGFTVVEIAAPHLRVDVVGPDSIRAGHPTAFDLVVGNAGNVDALSVPVWITGIPVDATVALDFPLTPLPQSGGEPDWSQVPDTLTSSAGRYMVLVLPRVPPGSLARRVYISVPSTHPTFRVRAAIAPSWSDGALFRSCLGGNGVIQDVACLGTQLTAINTYLGSTTDGSALNGIGEWAKIAWQCEGAPSLAAAIAESRQALDFMEQAVEQPETTLAGCGESVRPRWRDSLFVNVVGAVDPNDKVGKCGALSSVQAIPYTIHFENTGTVSAQDVIVSDVLPSTVDLGSLSLVAITFGSRKILPAPGRNSGTWDVDLRPDLGIIVRVEAGFLPPAALTRKMMWTFTSLDSSLRPLDPATFSGFLPPNQVPPQGEGSVVLTVMPLPGLGSGIQIQNQGVVKFDLNEQQTTPVWTNTVDNTSPSSRVLPLSPAGDSANFTVRWEVVGAPADLKDFTIYVREDEGMYRVWRQNVVATADTLAGERGHTYAFYSQARDTLGNIEPAHASPDAQTQLLVGVQTAVSWRLELAGAQPNPALGVIRARFTLPDREPALLDLIDVAGRRVEQRQVGLLGPGPHVVDLGGAPRLRPGLYFIRLAQRNRTLASRVMLLR